MNKLLRALALALVLGMTVCALIACGEEKDTDTELPYETLDMDGWSPIWTP